MERSAGHHTSSSAGKSAGWVGGDFSAKECSSGIDKQRCKSEGIRDKPWHLGLAFSVIDLLLVSRR